MKTKPIILLRAWAARYEKREGKMPAPELTLKKYQEFENSNNQSFGTWAAKHIVKGLKLNNQPPPAEN